VVLIQATNKDAGDPVVPVINDSYASGVANEKSNNEFGARLYVATTTGWLVLPCCFAYNPTPLARAFLKGSKDNG
jgi:hypothetical protein